MQILKEVNPKARIVVWSDMFDPNHNAVDKYYLVNGTLEESWEGLPQDVIIANWNGGKAARAWNSSPTAVIARSSPATTIDDLSNFETWDAAARASRASSASCSKARIYNAGQVLQFCSKRIFITH